MPYKHPFNIRYHIKLILENKHPRDMAELLKKEPSVESLVVLCFFPFSMSIAMLGDNQTVSFVAQWLLIFSLIPILGLATLTSGGFVYPIYKKWSNKKHQDK